MLMSVSQRSGGFKRRPKAPFAPRAIAPGPPRSRPFQIQRCSKGAPGAFSLGYKGDKFGPVRTIQYICRDGNTRRQHFCRMPPAARDKQKLPSLEDAYGGLGLGEQRELFKIRFLHAIDQGQIDLRGRRVKVWLLALIVENILLAPIDLEQKGVRGGAVIVQYRKRSAHSSHVQVNLGGRIQNFGNAVHQIRLAEPIRLEILWKRLDVLLERGKHAV